ncbi:MAG TPA: hypothetical protein PKA23_03455, partial [Accumulibacter sp.]|nr:hypothetical protein [Accumulibacter sp.]
APLRTSRATAQVRDDPRHRPNAAPSALAANFQGVNGYDRAQRWILLRTTCRHFTQRWRRLRVFLFPQL